MEGHLSQLLVQPPLMQPTSSISSFERALHKFWCVDSLFRVRNLELLNMERAQDNTSRAKSKLVAILVQFISLIIHQKNTPYDLHATSCCYWGYQILRIMALRDVPSMQRLLRKDETILNTTSVKVKIPVFIKISLQFVGINPEVGLVVQH